MKNDELKSPQDGIEAGCTVITIGIISLVLFFFAFTSCGEKKDPSPVSETMLIDRQFSAWDGSHKELVRYVKKRLNDPESFKHEDSRYRTIDESLANSRFGVYERCIVVDMTFRAKNGFGGYVKSVAIGAYTIKDGKILEQTMVSN